MRPRKKEAGAGAAAASLKSAGTSNSPDYSRRAYFPKSQLRGWPVDTRFLLAILL